MKWVAIVTLVLCGCVEAETWQPGRSTVPVGPREAGERRTCESDLACPLGFVCAKKAGSYSGDCARAVDEHFAPVDVPYGSASYGPGPRQCYASEDCPVAFSCDEGRCVR